MRWKSKARLFALLETLPFGDRLYYLVQRHVTRTLPRRVHPVEQTAADFIEHVRRFETHLPDFTGRVLFEFGAGWDLYSNLIYYCYGIQRQYSWDLQRLARPELINHCVTEIRNAPPPGSRRVPTHEVGPDFETDLERDYGIVYRAPGDAQNTGLAEKSVAIVTSTNTLEHIPEREIRRILGECRRMLSDDGLVSMRVDYSDHYQYSDTRITPYNFLTFTDEAWRRYNTDRHYQNRLRHSDYRRMFQQEGWTIVEESVIVPEGAREMLAGIALSPRFRAYERDDLAVLTGWFVLRKG